jgi:hypothetical protein
VLYRVRTAHVSDEAWRRSIAARLEELESINATQNQTLQTRIQRMEDALYASRTGAQHSEAAGSPGEPGMRERGGQG